MDNYTNKELTEALGEETAMIKKCEKMEGEFTEGTSQHRDLSAERGKCLIIVHSYHHNNTAKIADVFAEVLHAPVKRTDQVKLEELEDYDLIGFGAGIDSGSHYKELLDLADQLPKVSKKSCFIFSTSAIIGADKVAKDHSALRQKLEPKGYIVKEEFSCKGFNTNSFLKFFGGMNKGRPNSEDLRNAAEFALSLE